MPDDSLSYVGNFLASALEGTEGGDASKNAPQGQESPGKSIGDIYGEFFENFDLRQLYGDSFNYGQERGDEVAAPVNKWLESWVPSWTSMLIGVVAVGLVLLGAWAMLGNSTVIVEGDN